MEASYIKTQIRLDTYYTHENRFTAWISGKELIVCD